MKKLMLLCCMTTVAWAQRTIPLYPKGVPGLKENLQSEEKNIQTNPGDIILLRNITQPTLTIYQPTDKKSEAAVVVFPGGGYWILAMDHEGYDIGAWWAAQGYTAVVVKYRLPQEELFTRPGDVPLQDAQSAISWTRQHAEELGIHPSKIGVMGFSAGGHLAAMASNKWMTSGSRPDFSILVYPVISLNKSIGHGGSRENLLGKTAPDSVINAWSADQLVDRMTPPTFLVHATDDWVKVDNSLQYAQALQRHEVPYALHIYPRGGHGFALKKRNLGPIEQWTDRLLEWMRDQVDTIK